MNSITIMKYISWLGLALVMGPSLLALGGAPSPDVVKALALLGTIIWFAAAAMWMGRKKD